MAPGHHVLSTFGRDHLQRSAVGAYPAFAAVTALLAITTTRLAR